MRKVPRHAVSTHYHIRQEAAFCRPLSSLRTCRFPCYFEMQERRAIPLTYVSVRTLSGFEDTINCLQFNEDASYLAIGSDSGLFVVAHTSIIDDPVMEFRSPNGSAVTALLWNPEDPGSIFIGYSDGTVLICQVPLAQGAVSAVPNCREKPSLMIYLA